MPMTHRKSVEWKGCWHRQIPSSQRSGADAFGRLDTHDGWKVVLVANGTTYAIPLVYHRKKDAETAANAVAALLPEWPDDPDEVFQVILDEIGLQRLRQAMTECLQW